MRDDGTQKQRKKLNKHKIPKINPEERKDLILCPITDCHKYREVCIEKCWYYQRNKCPIQEEL